MNTFKKLLGLLILIVSLVMLAWAFWPVETTQANEPLQPAQMQLPPGSNAGEGHEGINSASGMPPGVTEARSVVLEYPLQMREGDSDVILLTLDVAANGLTATAQFGDHTTTETTVQIPNVYDTHSVQAEAQLDLPGISPNPAEPIVMQVVPGQKTSFAWTIKPELAGSYRGVVSMSLIFTPLSGGESTRQALYGKALGVDVVNLFGIGGQPARLMGLAGSVIGSFITIEDVVQWIFGRGKKDNRKRRR